MTLLSDGLRLKEEGKDRVEWNNQDFVAAVRAKAREIALENGHVSVDDLHKWADAMGIYPAHKNCWGTVFRGKDWVFVTWVQSTRATARGRWVRAWGVRDRWHF